MPTLKQMLGEKLEAKTMQIWSPATLDIGEIIRAVQEANKEWLTQNVKKKFYKNLMPDLSEKTQKAIEKSINELLEELK